ncbi:exonuclease [Ignicoccus pacificus DSM 13166]|uniref:Exonuclease n=1 Tax=Ignicoccus pacificus DSM 13166 TaxID=940294 RepID=A0A977PJM3_9CREN|nr:exonuclease [Ignicoccus pacificus DSM 13166]
MEVYLVAHAPTSVQRLEDFAKLAFNFGDPVKGLIVTKPSGVAAQVGLADVSKLAYKLDKKLIILPDIDDAIELLKPDEIYTVSHDFGERVEKLEVKGRALIIVGLTDPGLSKLEAQKGKAIYPSSPSGDIGPIASVAILLSGLKE